MRLVGAGDDAERAHELAELGDLACSPGPLRALVEAKDLSRAVELFGALVSDLDERVARSRPDDPKLPYHRSLVVLTRKVELELRAQVDGLARMNRELEEMHDLVHELFPVERA